MKPIIKWGYFVLGEESESEQGRFTLEQKRAVRLKGFWCSGQLHLCLLLIVFRDEGTEDGITTKP